MELMGEEALRQLWELIKAQQVEIKIATDTTTGVVKGGANVGVKEDGTMWVEEAGTEAITNLELDEICK